MDYKLPSRSMASNLLMLVLSAGLVSWSLFAIQTKFSTVTSLDAVVNGSLTDINALQEGTVSEIKVKTGDNVSQDKPLLTLKNERVSKLATQEITSRINQQRAQLVQAQAQLDQQLTLIQRLQKDNQNQQRLETLEAQGTVQQIVSDLKGAQARYKLSQLQYKRKGFLRAQGALSQAELDTATIEMEQRKAEVSSLEARIRTLGTSEQAAQLGLSLSKTRSNSDPRLRLEELQMQIANQRHVIQTLKQNIENAQAELTQAHADVQQKQSMVVKAPTTGVIWRLSAQQGKVVQQGQNLGQVLNCDHRWVDAFVDEQSVRAIAPGTPATIELYGSKSPVLHGRVSLVRSGPGRLTAGEDIAVPAAQNLPRATQVRIELDPSAERGSPNLYCYVGYTGKVTFKVK